MARPIVESRRSIPNRQLTELRINLGLSQRALGARAGISDKAVRRAEAGHVPTPRIQFAIASVLGKQPIEIWPLEVQPDWHRTAHR